MESQILINYTAEVLKEYSLQSGYSTSVIIAVAKPLFFELAADQGIKLNLSDLHELEDRLKTLDSTRVVSLAGRKKLNSGEKQVDYIEIKTHLQDLLAKILSQAIPEPVETMPRAKSMEWSQQYKEASNGSFAGFLKTILKRQ